MLHKSSQTCILQCILGSTEVSETAKALWVLSFDESMTSSTSAIAVGRHNQNSCCFAHLYCLYCLLFRLPTPSLLSYPVTNGNNGDSPLTFRDGDGWMDFFHDVYTIID